MYEAPDSNLDARFIPMALQNLGSTDGWTNIVLDSKAYPQFYWNPKLSVVFYTDSNGFTEAPTRDPNSDTPSPTIETTPGYNRICVSGRFNTFMTINGNYILNTIINGKHSYVRDSNTQYLLDPVLTTTGGNKQMILYYYDATLNYSNPSIITTTGKLNRTKTGWYFGSNDFTQIVGYLYMHFFLNYFFFPFFLLYYVCHTFFFGFLVLNDRHVV